MKKYTLTPIKVLSFLLFISFLFSCTKDSDLFAEVVLLDEISDIEESPTVATVDVENGVIQTDEDKITVFNLSDLSNSTNDKSTVLKNLIQPTNGQITIEKDSIASYYPNPDFNGTDSFDITLEVTDENDDVTERNISLEVVVNPMPDAVNDTIRVTNVTEMGINVLNNDTFKNKSNVQISDISTPTHGAVSLNSDKSIIYTPSATFTDSDSFTYTTEVVHEDQTITTEEGVVQLAVLPTTNSSTNANLLFASGFEGGTVLNDQGAAGAPADYYYLTGKDDVTGFSWDHELISDWGDKNSGIHKIIGGTTSPANIITNEIVTVPGHTGSNTKALYQYKWNSDGSYSGPGAQSPFQINNLNDNDADPPEIYEKFWIKFEGLENIDKDAVNPNWRMCWQYKSENFTDSQSAFEAYRISLFIQKDSGGYYWNTVADHLPGSSNRYWSEKSYSEQPENNVWYQIEVYRKSSREFNGNGIFWIKINGTQIAYREGANVGSAPGDSLKFWTLWQFYGAGGEQWIDDVEVWDGIPY